MDGDTDRESTLTVEYRETGTETWLPAAPALRSNGEIVGSYAVPNRWTGSVLNLEPDTSYDVRLTYALGAVSEVYTFTERTKKLLSLPTPTRTLHVYPADYVGEKLTPNWTTIAGAYGNAVAGDVVLIHAGTYTAGCTLNRSGIDGAPIVVRGEDSNTTIIQLGSGGVAFGVGDCAYNIIEGIGVDGGFAAVSQSSGSAHDLLIQNCNFHADSGIRFTLTTTWNITIANNVITGTIPTYTPRDDYYAVVPSNIGITIKGSGHDICGNTISYFVDGINLLGGTLTNPELRQHTLACDVYDNHVSATADDCIELDWSERNLRVYRNFFGNSHNGISCQPLYGGVAYIFRNVVWNMTSQVIKPNASPSGMLVVNNTFVSVKGFNTTDRVWSNFQFYNNLYINVDGDGNEALETGTKSPATSKSDYNGYRQGVDGSSNPLGFAWMFYSESGVRLAENSVTTLAELYSEAGVEQHGILVDTDIFTSYTAPTGTETPIPTLNFTLVEGCAAIGAGVHIAQITDGIDDAPDLGAYERD